MKVVAFIPARFGSTRLEGKPLKEIKGRPMVQWVYERVKRSGAVSEAAVATDDERIARAVRAFGGKAVMTSLSCMTGTERVAEAAKACDGDIIVNVQGDEPLMEPGVIDDCVRALIEDPVASISTPVTRMKDPEEFANPNVVKAVTDLNGFALYFSRSPIPYPRNIKGSGPVKKHIGLYVYRRDVLLKLAKMPPTPLEEAEGLEQLRAMENGLRIKVVETGYDPVSVDTPEDLERVRMMVGEE
ncbi:MAG: 3-deoxy-manno-octulosonate cytidylyltransferase [Deltaproteobacteria bacterium]|nr:3-deoxy-manno-octulosonate cytidylyltransferase [Deltaproteobacteria bacterium]